jgi:AcrR family transcriptional regulator
VGLQQERAIRTRRVILKSAAEMFDRLGYTAARLSDISARTGMSTGALHFHFENKEALACAVVDEARHTLWRAGRLALEKQTDPLQALTDVSHTLAQLLSWDVVSRAGFRLDNERTRAGRQQFINAWRACVQRLLDEARASGALAAKVHLPAMTCAIVAATTGIGILVKDDAADRTRLALTGFWQGFLPGLAAPHVRDTLEPGGTPERVERALSVSRCLPYDPQETARSGAAAVRAR